MLHAFVQIYTFFGFLLDLHRVLISIIAFTFEHLLYTHISERKNSRKMIRLLGGQGELLVSFCDQLMKEEGEWFQSAR